MTQCDNVQYVAGLIGLPTRDLEYEVLWTATILDAQMEKLRSFALTYSQVETKVWFGSLREAGTFVEEFVGAHGESIWALELRIALVQQTEGIEAQKTVARRIKQQAGQTITSFITHYVSERAEPNIDPSQFRNSFFEKIKRMRFKRGIQNYLKYRLTRELPNSQSELAEILSLEQSHTIYDLFLTFVEVLQRVAFVSPQVLKNEKIAKLIFGLSTLDYRLHRFAIKFIPSSYPTYQSECQIQLSFQPVG